MVQLEFLEEPYADGEIPVESMSTPFSFDVTRDFPEEVSATR